MQQANEKKYVILENETLEHHGKTLYRIQALKDFSDVKAGDKGGWIEREKNLSQEGDCWIYDDSRVCDWATVSENAKILNLSEVSDLATIIGKSVINRESDIIGNVFVKDTKISNLIVSDYTEFVGDFEITRPLDFYTFNLWFPFDEFVTYITKENIFVYRGQSYTNEELAMHEDFCEGGNIVLDTLNRIANLCNYRRECYN